MSGCLRRVATVGWWPAFLVVVVSATELHGTARLAVPDMLAYAAWLFWACMLPGTLLWRCVDWRRPRGREGRPFLEDVVLGTILGIAVVVPVHLLMVALGHPLLLLVWPVLVLVALAATARGREVLLSRQAEPTPLWWSWGLALLVLFAVLVAAHAHWYGAAALTPESLQRPYVDEPYHQSLVAEFSQHFPAQIPYVEGTPLRYHWLVYPFLAAGTLGSGADIIPVLRFLAPFTLSMLLLLGVAVAAARLTGHRWAALAGVLALVALAPLDTMGWTPAQSPFLGAPTWATYLSPTQSYANALCPLLVVLLVGILRGAWRGPITWVLTGLMLLAVAGAKSAMIPLFVAGLCGTVLVLLVLTRRVPRRLLGLAGLSLGVFGAATLIFYGFGSRAVTFGPFQLAEYQANGLGIADPDHPATTAVLVLLTIVYVGCALVPLVGGVGLFVRGGWRRPTGWVLMGCLFSAFGVVVLFRHPSFGQVYFRYSSVVPATLLTALGWARAVDRVSRRSVVIQLGAAATGAAIAFAVATLTSSTPPSQRTGGDVGRLVGAFGVPLLLALLLVAAIAGAFYALSPRLGVRPLTLPVVIALLVGLCLPYPLASAVNLLHAPAPEPPSTAPRAIRPGGIEAATWLKDHSTSDQLIATNVHTRLPRGSQADSRSFWISAWSERHVLVQGWAYVEPTSVGLPSNERTNRSGGPPFWDQPRLALNDEVFEHPTADNVRQLQEKYGVDWLLADRRRTTDLEGLAKLADEVHSTEGYVVFRLRG